MRRHHQLTAAAVRKIRKPGRHADGGGLYLNVSANKPKPTPRNWRPAKSWVFMWKRGGKREAMGLGSVDTVSLAEARLAAADARKLIYAEGDPREAKRAARAGMMTFGQVADELFESKSSDWSHAKHKQQWQRTLEQHCLPLRGKVVAEISTEHVLSVIKPMWTTTPETASRVRNRIEAVLDYATARKYRTGDNPARWKGHLKTLLPKPPGIRAREHMAAMPYVDLPAFMTKLRAVDDIRYRLLEFTILTAARSSEALGATWSEIDLEAKVWTVPKARMKGRTHEHTVPLSDRCLTILREMEKLRRSDLVFPGFKEGRRLGHATMFVVLQLMGVDATTHGFRSTFRDWCGDRTNVPREIAEAALAHRVGNAVELAYRRSSAFEKRTGLMQQWADFCEERTGDVIHLHGWSR